LQTDRFGLQTGGLGFAGRLAFGNACIAREAGRETGGMPLRGGGIIRLRPRPELLQQRLLGLCSRAQALVEIVVLVEGAHRRSFTSYGDRQWRLDYRTSFKWERAGRAPR